MLKIELADLSRDNGGDGWVGGGGERMSRLNQHTTHRQGQAGQICHIDTLSLPDSCYTLARARILHRDKIHKIRKWVFY